MQEKEKIILKKYSNRRLYDMSQKRYVTLEEVADRIQEGAEIQVLDSKTGEDITQLILIQIILDSQKTTGTYMFSSEFLHQMIQYRDQSMSEFFHRYLPGIMRGYLDWQRTAQEQFLQWARMGMNAGMGNNPYSRDFFMPGFPMWGGSYNPYGSKPSSSQSEPPLYEPDEREVAELKQKVKELEALLKKDRKKR